MSRQSRRAARGGWSIDRDREFSFTFDGRRYAGYAGDTLASALLANRVSLVGRSFKYHRPRGVLSAGAEEPHALVQLGRGSRTEANLRATQIELYEGLRARSQHRWPSLEFDVGALFGWASRLMPAGFYYKTFMGPRALAGPRAWMFFEWFIRRGAGLGRAPEAPDPDRYAKRYAHCDVLVIGAGPAGLMAALAAARSGARVIIADEQPHPGGALLGEEEFIDAAPALEWVARITGELEAAPRVRVLARTCAFGRFDDNLVALCERVNDHRGEPPPGQPRQRLWWVRARQVVLATGAIERPIVFENNDRPGVMLASAVRRYARGYAVACGRRALVFTNNDSAYATLAALRAVGTEVVAVVDARRAGPGAQAAAFARDVECLSGCVVSSVRGAPMRSATVHGYEASNGRLREALARFDCDLLCVSGGWSPTVHLYSQAQGRLHYDPAQACFVPGDDLEGMIACGAVRAAQDLAGCLREGARAGALAAERVACTPVELPVPQVEERRHAALEALWSVPFMPGHHGKRFVDLQDDVTAEDVALAAREGYTSVEHLKRYTTLGMGTDQGRTSNVNGLAVMGALIGKAVPEVGTTTFRPPYTPVTLGALAGAEIGAAQAPVRRTPMHDWHQRAGAPFVPAGHWLRAQYYPRPGEDMMQSIWREARHVREYAGIVDVSTLGKIAVQGRDAAQFLERVYVNRWRNLAVGRCRYGLMLREDGVVFDDGTTTRVGEHEFYMTTTTAKAAAVLQMLEFYAQTVWPHYQVHLTSVSDQWAALALAGPRSREVLQAAVGESAEVSDSALPFMGYREALIADVPVRLFRVTFSGERAYEIHAPAGHGTRVWEAVLEAGRAQRIIPYGTEAMNILRIEKGHMTGAELDGRSYPAELGFERLLRPDRDFIGARALEREAVVASARRLVGLESVNGEPIPRGAQLVWNPTARPPLRLLGHVTSRCFSPNCGKEIGLAMLHDAERWQGSELVASSPVAGRHVSVRVTAPVFVDPEGGRARG